MTTSPQSKGLLLTSLAIGASLLALQTHHRRDGIEPSIYVAPPVLPSSETSPSHRRLSIALPNGGCQITWPKPPPPNIQITYAASYPGCGARMTWNLVEALTGLETGDDWNNNGRGDKVVTVKTHYPQSNGILPEFDERITRAFLVVRNPMQSIPSFFNHIYEMRNHLPVHSERAPVEEWIKWRDHYLEEEITEYKKFMIYWMDRYTPENRYVITYEGLTDDLIGPEVTKGLNDFLGQAEGVEVIDRESVPCIWKAVVKNQPPEHQKEQIEKLQSSKAGGELEKGGPSVGVGVSESTGVVSNNANLPPPPSMAMVPNAVNPPPLPNTDMNHALPLDQSYNPGFQQPEQGSQLDVMNSAALGQPIPQPPKQVWPGSDKSLQNIYLDQNQQQFLQRQQQLQSMPVAGLGGGTSSQQVYPPAPGQLQSHQQHEEQFQQPPHQMQPYGQYPDMQQYQQPMQTMQYQQPMQNMQYDQHQPGNLRHRRLDPGHHDSQRKGPNVPRPYTVKQLELMMNMLSELGGRYRDDVRLSNIMKGYYEKVEKARNELAGGQGQEAKPAAPPGGFF
ncbi:hypothetical protein ACHAW6_006105 [Cyclotella cf. meneghiniana]